MEPQEPQDGPGHEEEKMVPSAPPMADPAYADAENVGDAKDEGPASNLFEVDMAIISVASLVLLTAAGKWCHDLGKCKNQDGFAVAVGVLGFVAAAGYLGVLKKNPDMLVPLNGIIGLSNIVFWAVAVGVLTFNRPFSFTGNGYFATWTAFLASAHFFYWSMPRVQNFVQQMKQGPFSQWSRKILLVILLASIVEVFAAANVCSVRDICANDLAWAVACGTISAAYVGVLLLIPAITGRFLHWFSTMLFIWWCIGAGIMTFDSPFPVTGNGFFACWIAVLASFYLMYFALFSIDDSNDDYEHGADGAGAYQDDGNPEFPSAEL